MDVNKKIAIVGKYSLSNGIRIIKYLESLGGINRHGLIGNSDLNSYFIDNDNTIRNCRIGNEPSDYKVLKTVPKTNLKLSNNLELWRY